MGSLPTHGINFRLNRSLICTSLWRHHTEAKVNSAGEHDRNAGRKALRNDLDSAVFILQAIGNRLDGTLVSSRRCSGQQAQGSPPHAPVSRPEAPQAVLPPLLLAVHGALGDSPDVPKSPHMTAETSGWQATPPLRLCSLSDICRQTPRHRDRHAEHGARPHLDVSPAERHPSDGGGSTPLRQLAGRRGSGVDDADAGCDARVPLTTLGQQSVQLERQGPAAQQAASGSGKFGLAHIAIQHHELLTAANTAGRSSGDVGGGGSCGQMRTQRRGQQ
mmetsp:Transcript_19993/g.69406  ORF Transcript_19993/g.69406 Transcript_19993/m.69406 type:complete len:275 (-) Transcript_19993:1116-1940(-)